MVAALFLPKLLQFQTITIYGYIGDRQQTSKRATSVMFILGQLFTSRIETLHCGNRRASSSGRYTFSF